MLRTLFCLLAALAAGPSIGTVPDGGLGGEPVVGDRVDIVVRRDGDALTLPVTLGRRG